MSDDPFYGVRDNVNSQVERIKVKNEKFQHMVQTIDTASSPDFKELRKTLFKDVRTAEKDLKGLVGAIDMIRKNRQKFTNVKDSELTSRTMFVDESQGALNKVKADMDSVSVRQKMEADEKLNRSRQAGAGDDATSQLRREIHTDNSRFVNNQRATTQQTINQQDESLDGLGRAVDRLGEIGRNINQEVKEQNVLLDHLDREVDESTEKMNVVQEALGKLLKTKDGCQIWTIVILGVILILLVCLVIWT